MGFILKKLSTFILKKLLSSNTVLTSSTKELVLKELEIKNQSISQPLNKPTFKKLAASNISLTQTADKFTFKELFVNAFVAIIEGWGFRQLTTTAEPITPPDIPPIIGLDPDNFNLGILGLTQGTYIITATTEAESLRLAESKHSDYVKYTVE